MRSLLGHIFDAWNAGRYVSRYYLKRLAYWLGPCQWANDTSQCGAAGPWDLVCSQPEDHDPGDLHSALGVLWLDRDRWEEDQ